MKKIYFFSENHFKACRPLVLCLSVLCVLAAPTVLCIRQGPGREVQADQFSILRYPYDIVAGGFKPRGSKEECRSVHYVESQCSFVRKQCRGDEAGLVPYISLYFCEFESIKPLGLLILLSWLAILFASIGISASDFLCVNLATMADMLGMSQTLAGVTFLAFGNGSPDVFSTWAAFRTHNGSLAVGELIGAAAFITSVIAGSMAVIKPFHVSRKSFVRDALFFTVAAAFSLSFLADGQLTLWESITMVTFYVLYVFVVLLWHSVAHRRVKKRNQLATTRDYFDVSESTGVSNQLQARSASNVGPVGPDGSDSAPERRSNHHHDLLVDGTTLDSVSYEDDVAEMNRERFLSEVGPEIRRMHRRTLSRITTPSGPIRPSLLGALEFGSVITSLDRSRSTSTSQVPARRHSHHTSAALDVITAPGLPASPESHLHMSDDRGATPAASYEVGQIQYENVARRARSVSANAANILHLPIHTRQQSLVEPRQSLQVETASPISTAMAPSHGTSNNTHTLPTIRVDDISYSPGDTLDSGLNTPLRPFPSFTDQEHIGTESSTLNNQAQDPVHPTYWYHRKRGIRLFSRIDYLIPSRREIYQTLFPGLENWKDRGPLSRFIGLSTAPTVLILTLTVPVVQIDTESFTDPGDVIHVSQTQVQPKVSDEQTSLIRINHTDPLNNTINNISDGALLPESHTTGYTDREFLQTPEDLFTDSFNSDRPTNVDMDASPVWKPWLLGIQILTSPQFFLFTFLADDSESWRQLSVWFLITLIGSLVIFVVFTISVKNGKPPSWQKLAAFPGFCVSIAWVSLIAGEVVGVLKAIGVIARISDAILGLTVFAVGNSLSDLLANLAIAKLGYPVMALSACFGSPMLNILLGIGLGGLSVTLQRGHKSAHGGGPSLGTHFDIDIDRSLIISSIGLLVTLSVLLVAVPMSGWIMSRKLGLLLIIIWCVTSVVNILLELVY